jgi:hypothetical protein
MILEKKQLKIFWILIAIFLISYIILIVCIVQIKNSEKHTGRFDRKAMVAKFLKKDIGFSEQQLMQFDSLNAGHQQKINSIRDSIRNYKDHQFKLLASANFNDSAMQIAVEKSVAAHRILELDQLKYIKSIRQLCTPSQIIVFDTSYFKIMSRRGQGKEKRVINNY